MKAPIFLFLAALGAATLAVLLPLHDGWLMLAVIVGAGALVLALVEMLRSVTRRKPASGPVVVLDGSNIMHWNGGQPDLATVRAVIGHLGQQGYQAGVVFDANAGYKLLGKYQHHQALARRLGLPDDLVMVVNKGEPADAIILRVAQDFGARVVTNDRFRDWASSFPQVAEPGFLIRGRFRDGALQLDL